jgi:mRNA interferase MazF
MKESDVVIVPLPQSDGVVKNRPAVILREMPPSKIRLFVA